MALPKNGDFSRLLGKGENPNGLVAQTVNGTVVNGVGGDGVVFRFPGEMADGPRWNEDPRPERVRLGAMAPILPRRK
jgi:hypothetical protein